MSALEPLVRSTSQSTMIQACAQGLTIVAAISALVLSNLMLSVLGVNYEGAGGAGWQKIHPSTYLCVMALFTFAAAQGNPTILLDTITRRHKGSILLLLTIIGLGLYVLQFLQGPVTQLIDALVAPLLMFVLLALSGERALRRLALAVHIIMATNALLGLVEFSSGFRLTPLMAEGIVLVTDWRSSALFGHPLSNAAATAGYALMLLMGGGKDLPRSLLVPALVLQVLAMPVFGGRAATALFILFAGALALWRVMAGPRITITSGSASVTILALVLGVGVTGVLLETGFFDRFVNRFIDDQGSAQTRMSMFYLLDRLPVESLWFGTDARLLATLQRLEGIPFGIESFWVGFIASYGIIPTVPLLLALGAFFNDVRRWGGLPMLISIILFILICSTSASLASKTQSLTIFIVQAVTLLRPRRHS